MVEPSERKLLGLGAILVVLTALGWALLSWRMAAGGEAPTSLRGAVPVSPEAWYRTQALWIVPVVLGLWVAMGALATLLSRRAGGKAGFVLTLGAIGVGWSGPLQTFLVLPELVLYELWGMDALRAALPIVGLATLVGTVAGTSLALGVVHELSPGRARGVAVLVLLAGAVLGSPFIR